MRSLSFFIVVLFSYSDISAQHSTIFLGNNFSSNVNNLIYNPNSANHTSFKPIFKSDLDFDIDSVLDLRFNSVHSSWFLRKLFSEHLISLKGKDYDVIMSPVINFSKGNESNQQKNISVNTRGFIIEGNLGNKISFFSSFLENQAIFPNYLDEFIRNNKVVPGQGYARVFKQSGFDYAMSSGYVSYRPNKMFAIQFGHGKHFIGDGYRSLMLSDNTFNYPYLRLQTTFWKLQYTNLYTELQDINYFLYNDLPNFDQMGYAKKYMSAHYLSINATKKINISIYESVVWRMNHAPGNTGFDVNYLNPITMLRPAEFSINSPDNVLVGLSVKYSLFPSSYFYGQFVLDEFSLTELRKKEGFWGNKYAYQLGYKVFNAFGFNNLTLQTEYNLARPYTYSHHNPQQNYAHYNQSLAHPLGANFSEWIMITEYKWKKWQCYGKLIFAKYGADISGDQTSYGNNVYLSSGNFYEEEGSPSSQYIGTGRPSDFGIELYQGNLTSICIKNFNIAYVINPKTNLKLNLGITIRDFKDDYEEKSTKFINFGLVSDLFNTYYDF